MGISQILLLTTFCGLNGMMQKQPPIPEPISGGQVNGGLTRCDGCALLEMRRRQTELSHFLPVPTKHTTLRMSWRVGRESAKPKIQFCRSFPINSCSIDLISPWDIDFGRSAPPDGKLTWKIHYCAHGLHSCIHAAWE